MCYLCVTSGKAKTSLEIKLVFLLMMTLPPLRIEEAD